MEGGPVPTKYGIVETRNVCKVKTSAMLLFLFSSNVSVHIHHPIYIHIFMVAMHAQVLFVAAGVFNMHDPSDLLPELQSRLPIRVQLRPFTEEEYKRIVPILLEQQV